MKKLLAIVFVLVTVGIGMAASLNPSAYAPIAAPTTTEQTLYSSASKIVTATAIDMGMWLSKHTCTIVADTAATSHTVSLYGSNDGTTWDKIVDGHVYTVGTAGTQMFHVVNKPVRYIKGGYEAATGGSSTSKLTLKCVSGGN